MFFHLGSQSQHGLAVQLGYSRFRQAENLSDFLEIQFFVIIERNNYPLLFRERLYGFAKRLYKLKGHQLVLRIFSRVIFKKIQQAERGAVIILLTIIKTNK
jgi:hypothetical protein